MMVLPDANSMSRALGATCLVTATGWFVWVGNGNWYGAALSAQYADDMGCHDTLPAAKTFDTEAGYSAAKKALTSQCLAGYLMWFTPFIVAVCCFVFAVVRKRVDMHA
jgi:hypothetical protein